MSRQQSPRNVQKYASDLFEMEDKRLMNQSSSNDRDR